MRRLLFALLLATTMPLAAFADTIDVKNVTFGPAEDGFVVNADFGVGLSTALEEALNSGVALHFLVEFELERPRWYWFNEKEASERLQLGLRYHALSRQYRVSRGSLYQNFFSLTDALRAIGTVRDWTVIERERVKPGQNYVASVRMRLDSGQLPKPFQVSALTNREWALASDWKRLTVNSSPEELPAR